MHSPFETTALVSDMGYSKTKNPCFITLINGVLGGMFIALGAMFSVTTMTGITQLLPYGLAKLVGGGVFCLGLILCVLAGAQLYTGNALLVIAKAEKRISS